MLNNQKKVTIIPKRKSKKDLRELAMINRYDLGGFRYKKEYEPMVQFAYNNDKKQLAEMKKKLLTENTQIAKERKQYIKKKGTKWSMEFNKIMVKVYNNADKTLNVMYAQDLLKLHKEKYIYWRKKR